MRAPKRGGLLYMGRIMDFIWDKTHNASCSEDVNTDTQPTRSPYKPKLYRTVMPEGIHISPANIATQVATQ